MYGSIYTLSTSMHYSSLHNPSETVEFLEFQIDGPPL